MNPWTRLGLAAGGVIAAALLLRALHPLVLLTVLVVGAAVLGRTLRQRSRAEAVHGRAAPLGLRPEAVDPFGLRALPLSLFGRAPEGSIEDLMHGSWRGVEVRAFDYVFPAAHGSEVRRAFSCALGSIGAPVPAVVVEPESFVAMLSGSPELDLVDLGGGRFKSLFEVRSSDEDAARSMLSDRMIEWLLGLDEACGFEVNDRAVLAYGPRSDNAEPPLVLDALVGFLDRLPGSVRHPAGEGPEPTIEPTDG